jgi:hypothetical protein
VRGRRVRSTGSARGLCGRHDKQTRRHGSVQPDRSLQTCAAEGCERQAVTRGWCHGHYLRWSRAGTTSDGVPLDRRPPALCDVADCSRPHHSHGLCRSHLERARRHGDVDPERPVSRRPPGGGSISHGYRKVIVPVDLLPLTRGERNVLQHRLVMAVLLGRPLEPAEVVHHLNGDRLDNRPANLELWSVDQPKGQRVTDKVRFALELLELYHPDAAAAARLALLDDSLDAEGPADS